MAKNQSTKSSNGVYEKMKSGLSMSPFQSIFRISNHQTNNAPIPPVQTNSARAYVSQSKPASLSQPSSGESIVGDRAQRYAEDNKIATLVPTESGQAKPHTLDQKHGKAAKISNSKDAAGKEDKTKPMFGMMTKRRSNAVSKADHERSHFLAPEGQLKPSLERENCTSNGVNDECSEYINRVKNNMGTGSNHGIERTATKNISRRDSFNDKLTSFLNRARIKMRTTSSNIGDVRSISFNKRSANDR